MKINFVSRHFIVGPPLLLLNDIISSPSLINKPFKIFTDYSVLKRLQKISEPTERRARWIMELQQYNYTIEYRSGKKNQNADALSRLFTEHYIKN